MTPEDLRADIRAFDDGIYLNTGASSPAPERVIEATCDYLRFQEERAPLGDGAYGAAYDAYEETRDRLAPFLGVAPETIALTESTADGISRVAGAIDWEAGDVVVRTDAEHPSGIVPWWNLERLGVETRVVPTHEGRLDLEAYERHVEDAKLVCLSSLTWNYGTRLPVAEAVEIAHDAGALVLVDAVQSVGQVPLDLTEWDADFVAGAGHKWLMGPWGAGFVHVHPDAVAALQPVGAGYRAVEDSKAPLDEMRLREDAGRIEYGGTSPAPYAGLQEALDLVDDIGMDTITGRIEELTDRLKAGLGDRLRSPREYESGLVSFTAADPDALVERLRERNVFIRSLPYPNTVRASLHVYNTPGDVDALLDALE
ncbi:MAG: aminotransferase class V-fold PLP-dependent enzyme [Haloferacaceae archaeon]